MTRRALQKRLKAAWGTIPDPMYFDGDMDSIRAYYEFRREQGMDRFLIDEITWADLDLDRIFKRINLGLSTSGEQYLYYQLRSPAIDSASYADRASLIRLMEEDADLRLALQTELFRLGRSRRANLSTAFSPAAHGIGWLIVYLLLVLLIPVLLVLAALTQSPAWLFVVIALLAFNAFLHEYRQRQCQGDFDTVNYTVSMVLVLNRIRRQKQDVLTPHLESAYAMLDRLRFVVRTGGVSIVRDGGLGEMLSTVLLSDLIVYEFLKNRLGRCYAAVFAVHEALGRLDAAIAIASWRVSMEKYTLPQIDFKASAPFVDSKGMVHPLLPDAVPNDLCTTAPILITGSNASGKSTYLKTAALCALLAQSVCTVPADAYRASAFRIYSSMALKDNLAAGESYYIVETRSLRRILDRTEGGVPILCAVDEVLRGTNTVERIAASSTILEELARHGVLCLAATHDIELCALLGGLYALYHFEEQVGEDEMLFDYRIRPGKATSRNAINLLRLMGFEERIVERAHERANAYTELGFWR